MADNTVLNPGAGGAVIATDNILNVNYQRVKPVHGLPGSATDASATNPLPVSRGLVSPKFSKVIAVAIAAGGSSDLDSPQITSGKTAELSAILVGASVPIRAEIKIVSNGVATSVMTVFATNGSKLITMPDQRYVSVAESPTVGFDGFRSTMTNMDPSTVSDVHTTFFYDER